MTNKPRELVMKLSKKKKLEAAGWTVGEAKDFLNLTAVEEKLIDMKIALSVRLRKTREQKNLTQTGLAKKMGSSQSRVAKMEAGDPSVTLDLLVHGLLAAGDTEQDIASALVLKQAGIVRRKSAA
jgi:DNA-binding XRE family transcriptional regulator